MIFHYSPDPARSSCAPVLGTIVLCVTIVCATILISTKLVCRAIGEKHQSIVKIELAKPIMEVK